ncbi:MAG: ATP-binding cassette domain-containing protein [Acidobacteriales bacterium]|nr:ATP-binding cassette domain-containing protein [Terriglobales bacterium]
MRHLEARIKKRFASPGSPLFELDVHLVLPAGFTMLFGPSGAGKSTVLDCISGLLLLDDGRVQIGDRMLFDSAANINVPPQHREIGYVFQRAALFPNMSVEQNIGYGLAKLAPGEREQKVSRVLESFNISALRRRMPKEISGGEQQRVALARSLVTEPQALLLDEPLSALDARIKRKILDDLLAWNAARGIPILYVTHSHAETLALGQRMVRLDAGKVVAEGTPAEVLTGEEVLD